MGKLTDYNSREEAEQAGRDLLAGIIADCPWLDGRLAFATGVHPVTGKHTLTLLLDLETAYPLDVAGLISYRDHFLGIRRQ